MIRVEDHFSAQGNSIADARTGAEQSPRSTDVNFFTSMLEGSLSVKNTAARPDASLLLTEVSNQLSNSRNGFAKVIRSTKKGIDVEAIGTYPRELHNAQLTSQLMVKCLAKTTQCIDKIGNMQS